MSEGAFCVRKVKVIKGEIIDFVSKQANKTIQEITGSTKTRMRTVQYIIYAVEISTEYKPLINEKVDHNLLVKINIRSHASVK